jgi:virulence-associated protein VagC
MKRAKVVAIGRRQAIQLPADFHVNTDTVLLRRTPEGFMVITRDPWDLFFEGIAALSPDFFRGGRRQPRLNRRKYQ